MTPALLIAKYPAVLPAVIAHDVGVPPVKPTVPITSLSVAGIALVKVAGVTTGACPPPPVAPARMYWRIVGTNGVAACTAPAGARAMVVVQNMAFLVPGPAVDSVAVAAFDASCNSEIPR